MKKKIKGFTLIELLAIIVILAIIAVITVPLILNVIEDSKKGAAQDSSYGYKDAIEKFTIEQMGKNYNFKLEDKTYTTEELKNLGLKVSGKEPTSGQVKIEKNMVKSFTQQYDKFTCNYPVNNKVECGTGTVFGIKNINLERTSNSITVTTTVNGTVNGYYFKIGEEEFVSSNTNTYTFNNLEDNTEYEIIVKVKNSSVEDTKSVKITTKNLSIGTAITYGGYNWHVIRNYEENDKNYQTLLMDAGQLQEMEHCTNDTDESTDCDTDGTEIVYSWDKSLIQTYLNSTFINELQTKGVDTSKIKKEKVCVDPAIGGSSEYSYGGYIKEEIDAVSGTCSKYEEYQIRLITASEYYNLSYYYVNTQLPYEGVLEYGNSGKAAKLDGMERLDETESKSWLYSDTIGYWWGMGSYSGPNEYNIRYTRRVNLEGRWGNRTSSNPHGVRPVITIEK